MNPDQENFQNLRRLLALKRYEQPPPGYFNRFSSEVIARIPDREAQLSWFERLFGEDSWLQQVWATLGARPALAGAFGVAVCGLLVAGAIFSGDDSSNKFVVVPATSAGTVPVQTDVQPSTPVLDHALPVNFSSTSGTLPQTSPSIFQEFKDSQRPLFQRLGQTYVVPVGN